MGANVLIPISNSVLDEEEKEEVIEKSIPVITPSGTRTNMSELLERQNEGLEKIKKLNALNEELQAASMNIGENIIGEISKNTVSKDTAFVNDTTDDITMVDSSVTTEVKVEEGSIFDYNAPISDNTFSSPEGEKEIFENLNETLTHLNETAKEVQKVSETIKKVETNTVHVIPDEKEKDDTFALDLGENDVATPEEKEEVVEQVEIKEENNDGNFIIENNDTSIFTEVETLMEEDLYNIADDPSSEIVVPLNDAETIVQAMEDSNPINYKEVIKKNPRFVGFVEKLRETVNNPRSYLHRVHVAGNLFYSAQQNFNRDALEAAVKRNNDHSESLTGSAKIGNKVIRDIMANKEEALRKFNNGTVIKSSVAVTTAVMLTQGIKRVQLFNSGFNVDIRAPKLSELAEYWRESTSTEDEYGRLLGQLCYLPADIYYKRAAMNLLEKLVVNSNLEEFNTPGTLRKALSFLDFDTVMWAIGSLMFPKGLEADFLCHNKNCRYVEKNRVSVKDMRYNDWSLLSTEDILFTISNEKRNLEALTKYRERIKNRGVSKKINDEWSAVFRIPTMYEMEASHLAHLAELTKEVQLTALADAAMYVAVKYYGILAPFIDELTYRSPESGKIIKMAGDILPSTLEALQTTDDIDFADTVRSFINDSKISHICFSYNKCPKCGELPSSGIGHLIPCDVHRVFFTWMTLRLTQLV